MNILCKIILLVMKVSKSSKRMWGWVEGSYKLLTIHFVFEGMLSVPAGEAIDHD